MPDEKFAAAESAENGLGEGAAQEPCHGDERFIALLDAVGVIEVPQVAEFHSCHGQGRLAAMLDDILKEGTAIRQPREFVGTGGVAQPHLIFS